MGRVAGGVHIYDTLGNIAGADLLAGYQTANKDEGGATEYYGFLDSSGNWYIQRVTGTDIDFTRGSSNYAANWTGRAGLSYAKFDSVF